MLSYFAHSTGAQHTETSKLPLFIAFSVVILAALVVAVKILSKPEKPAKKVTKS